MPFRHGISYCEKVSSGIDLDDAFLVGVNVNAINHQCRLRPAKISFTSLFVARWQMFGWRALDYYVPTTRQDITLVPTEVLVSGVSAPRARRPYRRPMLLTRALTKETLQIRHRARLETHAARLGLSVGAARQRADEPARRRAPRRIGHIRTGCVRTGDGLPGPIEFRQIHFALGT